MVMLNGKQQLNLVILLCEKKNKFLSVSAQAGCKTNNMIKH